MSHFTTISIQIKNGEILQQVLQDCGYQVEKDTHVRGYQGKTTTAEYVIRQKNGYDLGFRRQGESYEIVADFWGTKIKQQEFVNQIAQKYAHRTLLQSVEEQGFAIEEEAVLEDGTIKVTVGRWR